MKKEITNILIISCDKIVGSFKNPGPEKFFRIGTISREIANLIDKEYEARIIFLNIDDEKNEKITELHAIDFEDQAVIIESLADLTPRDKKLTKIIRFAVFERVSKSFGKKSNLTLLHEAENELKKLIPLSENLKKVLRK